LELEAGFLQETLVRLSNPVDTGRSGCRRTGIRHRIPQEAEQ
jgi:hypothetical protein